MRVPHILVPRLCAQDQLKVTEYATSLVLDDETTKTVEYVHLANVDEVEIVDWVRS